MSNVFKEIGPYISEQMGRSPEEKVKGHSGAIYRGPLMLYTKYQCSSRFLQADFQISLYYYI